MHSIAVPVIPRRMQFDFASASMQDWCRGDPVNTAFMNGISLALPLGEHFFIRAIRQFENGLTDLVLKYELKRFVAQEAIHSNQHREYNRQLAHAGFEISRCEARTQQVLDELWAASSPMERLAATIALEHITHVLADRLLARRHCMEGWSPEFRAFWLWHSAEEIEHKAVCFDLYKKLGGSHLMRSKALLKVSRSMMSIFWQNQSDLLEQGCRMRGEKMPSVLSIQRSNLEFSLLRSDSVLRGGESAYFAWFLPNYHPWQHDNRAALNRWKHDLLPQNHVSDIEMPEPALA